MTDDNTNSTDSSVHFSPDTKEERESAASIEEGILSSSRRLRHAESSRLSVVSKQYDIRNEGHLDETEQQMRAMDREGRGYISNEQVYSLLQEQSRIKKALLNAKRLLLFFAALLLILAVANIGK